MHVVSRTVDSMVNSHETKDLMALRTLWILSSEVTARTSKWLHTHAGHMHSYTIFWPQSYTRVIWIIIPTKSLAVSSEEEKKSLFELSVQSKMTIFEGIFDCDFNWKSISIHWAEEPKSSQISRLTDSAMPTFFFYSGLQGMIFLSICDTCQELIPSIRTQYTRTPIYITYSRTVTKQPPNEIRKNDWNFFHGKMWIRFFFGI